VAFPAIICGAYGYPLEEACRVAVDTTLDFLSRDQHPQRVTFVLFGAAERRVYEDCLADR
jgi:O-acetyl-ADP-ribose deacetylase (regulator of RNase III)